MSTVRVTGAWNYRDGPCGARRSPPLPRRSRRRDGRACDDRRRHRPGAPVRRPLGPDSCASRCSWCATWARPRRWSRTRSWRCTGAGRRLEDPERAPAYLRRTVVNRSRSALRHRGVVQRHLARQHRIDEAPPADEPVLADSRRRAVLDALQRLPRRQREVLALRYYLDLSESEIAETLGISRGAVKSHASRGSAALRPLLAPHQKDGL
ncbi:sigma-70 family RNA polymerase sigma factor [Nocardioides convexus]|uniref:RNA polymerase sigma factor n=1 Tax=Nocardioides convexus TaxID=2712224 RepID=UPI0024184147|nr:sigma-70 family RNA polymerase sigma factor [Nocardioides convexus]